MTLSRDATAPRTDGDFSPRAGAARNLIDLHVGGQVRLRRLTIGMTLIELAAAIFVAPEKLQQFESGSSRIGAATLYEISKILTCQPVYFFEGLPLWPSFRADGL